MGSQYPEGTKGCPSNWNSSTKQTKKAKEPENVTIPVPVTTAEKLQHEIPTSVGSIVLCSKAIKENHGYLSSSTSKPHRKREPEIVTVTLPGTQTHQPFTNASALQHDATASLGMRKEHPAKTSMKFPEKGPSTSWNDELLKKRSVKGGTTILWRPGSGRHVSEGPNSYRPFTHITRTVHLEDAATICITQRIEPKKVVTFSSIDSRELPPAHPCEDLKVLWFSTCTRLAGQDEDEPDWYGNVEFAVNAKILQEQWKYSFLVEMMTTPTHTTSRILVTNTDYSAILPHYDRYRAGGPWQVTPEGQFALISCSRFRFRGTNRHEHILEFMLEVTPEDEKKILNECQISFKNHEEAQDMTTPHVCNRYQRAGLPCPTPFPRYTTATHFFHMLQQNNIPVNLGMPKLSKSAQQYLWSFLEEEKTKPFILSVLGMVNM